MCLCLCVQVYYMFPDNGGMNAADQAKAVAAGKFGLLGFVLFALRQLEESRDFLFYGSSFSALIHLLRPPTHFLRTHSPSNPSIPPGLPISRIATDVHVGSAGAIQNIATLFNKSPNFPASGINGEVNAM